MSKLDQVKNTLTDIPQPPLRAGEPYEDIADALGAEHKREPGVEVVRVVTAVFRA